MLLYILVPVVMIEPSPTRWSLSGRDVNSDDQKGRLSR